jgi:hypothetical protein
VTRKIRALSLGVLLPVTYLTFIGHVQTSWWRAYGGKDFDEGRPFQQPCDSGYCVAGFTRSFGAGGGDAWLIKTDAQGDTVWAKTYGGAGNEDAQRTTDGGYIIVAGNGRDVRLIKTDAQGDTLWTRTYGGTDANFGFSVQQTSDGGYIIAGDTKSYGAGYWDFYLIRTNAHGDTLWTRTYGGTGSDGAHSVRQAADGGYIVAGTTSSFGTGKTDIYLVKTDARGHMLWARPYGGPNYEEGRSVQPTTDGGYIVVGWTGLTLVTTRDAYVVKTDSQGDTLWTKTCGGAGVDDFSSVQQTADGGYIMAGTTSSQGAGGYDVYVVRMNTFGDILWTKTYGGRGDDDGSTIRQTIDGGYVVTGSTSSFGTGKTELFLIETDSMGYIGMEGPWPWHPANPIRILVKPDQLTSIDRVQGHETDVFTVSDVTGRRVVVCKGDRIGAGLRAGVYFLSPVGTRQASRPRWLPSRRPSDFRPAIGPL